MKGRRRKWPWQVVVPAELTTQALELTARKVAEVAPGANSDTYRMLLTRLGLLLRTFAPVISQGERRFDPGITN